MSKTLVGIVTFGLPQFTAEAIRSVKETVTNPYDIFVVVGKPNDLGTQRLLIDDGVAFITHARNMGFPASLNDIYDYGWKANDYDQIVIMGNDVIAYPYAIDRLINEADNSDFVWIGATQYTIQALLKSFPECKRYFIGSNYTINDFTHRCWEKFKGYENDTGKVLSQRSDVHNLCLYKKEVFDAIGYIDVNFYPAYFEDNDYATRGKKANLKMCKITNSYYFHFWSRTIHQGSGGSTGNYFRLNGKFYKQKWGGGYSKERFSLPFNGKPYTLTSNIILPVSINIQSRIDEQAIISHWLGKGK